MNRNKPIDSVEVEAIRNLQHRMAYQMRTRGMARKPESSDLQWIDQHVLEIVAGREPVAIKDVREHFGMPQSSLTSVINRLESRGLLVRRIHPEDRRSYLLAVTDTGREAQKLHAEEDRRMARSLLEPLDVEERQVLVRLLTKIAAG